MAVYHLLQPPLRYGQTEQLAAFLTLCLARPCWSLVLFSPVIEFSLNGCQVCASLMGTPSACPADNMGSIWGYVYDLIRSEVIPPRPQPARPFLYRDGQMKRYQKLSPGVKQYLEHLVIPLLYYTHFCWSCTVVSVNMHCIQFILLINLRINPRIFLAVCI